MPLNILSIYQSKAAAYKKKNQKMKNLITHCTEHEQFS